MSSERRFDERQVAAIVERATMAGEHGTQRALQSSASRTGLTLAQLEDIGDEVGIPRAHIARAAADLIREESEIATQSRWLGMPVAVSRTVPLGRTVSDDEWERIVVLLRQTFSARGKMVQQGNFRQWTNGNLQALLEPTADGHQLRLLTRKGSAREAMQMGTFMAIAGAVVTAVVSQAGTSEASVAGISVGVVVAAVGAITASLTAIRLPSWARLRAQQMQDVARTVAEPDVSAR